MKFKEKNYNSILIFFLKIVSLWNRFEQFVKVIDMDLRIRILAKQEKANVVAIKMADCLHFKM